MRTFIKCKTLYKGLFSLMCTISIISWYCLQQNFGNNNLLNNINKRNSFYHVKSTHEKLITHKQKVNSLKIYSALSCFSWKYSKIQRKNSTPAVNLDPERILYPGIVWGPNNQLKGLKESIYLAVRTNRTLVIPSFTSHYTHNNAKLEPQNFIDVEQLCSFVSCISEEKMREFCNGTFDVAFQTHFASLEIIQSHEKKTSMKIIQTEEEKIRLKDFPHFSVVNLADKLMHQKSTKQEKNWKDRKIKFKHDINAVKEVYHSDASCAILTVAFNSFPAMRLNLFPINVTDTMNYNSSLTNASDHILMYAINQAVRRPPAILNAVSHYVKKVLGGRKFIGVHWRYNLQDWALYCKAKYDAIIFKNTCDYLKLIQPVDTAIGIYKKFREFLDFDKLNHSISVYIASPSDMNNFVKSVYEELERIDKKFLKPKNNFETFLTKIHKDCWNNKKETNSAEIISLGEMEIMARSTWFYYAAGSTWSSNVRVSRIKEENSKIYIKDESEIFELAQAQLELRINKSRLTKTDKKR